MNFFRFMSALSFVLGITCFSIACSVSTEPSAPVQPPAPSSDGFISITIDPCISPSSTQIFYAKLWLGWWGSHDAIYGSESFIGPALVGYPTSDDFDPTKTGAGTSYWSDTRLVAMVYGFQHWETRSYDFNPGRPKDAACGYGFLDVQTYRNLQYYVTYYRPM